MTVPNSPAWDPSIKPVPYDPAMAKQLLAQASYPNGFKLPVGIEFTPLSANPDLAAAIQSNLRDVGIEAQVTSYELAAFLDKYYGRNGQVKGDLFIQATGDGNGFMSQAQGLYSCESTLVWWCNQDFEKNMQLADVELDVAKRSVLMRKAIAGFTDDVAHLNLIIAPSFIVTGPKAKGFTWDNATAYRFDDVYKID
jgi:peptide/nickel transport system substrate-binding protein